MKKWRPLFKCSRDINRGFTEHFFTLPKLHHVGPIYKINQINFRNFIFFVLSITKCLHGIVVSPMNALQFKSVFQFRQLVSQRDVLFCKVV